MQAAQGQLAKVQGELTERNAEAAAVHKDLLARMEQVAELQVGGAHVGLARRKARASTPHERTLVPPPQAELKSVHAVKASREAQVEDLTARLAAAAKKITEAEVELRQVSNSAAADTEGLNGLQAQLKAARERECACADPLFRSAVSLGWTRAPHPHPHPASPPPTTTHTHTPCAPNRC